jgi:hypothetical protein
MAIIRYLTQLPLLVVVEAGRIIQAQYQQQLLAQMAGLVVAVLVLHNLQIEMVAQEIHQSLLQVKEMTVEMETMLLLTTVRVGAAGLI